MYKKKSLGQNFLKSQKNIDEIVSVSETNKNDLVLEIGPGEGTLTSALISTGANIVVVEKDNRLIPMLSKKFSEEILSGQLKIIHDDILNFDIKNIGLEKKYKIVANIPYYITGQIIRKFLQSENQPESMTLLLQKEVAERIVAKDGKESLLSISVKTYGLPKYMKTVGRGAFDPQPNVDSAVIHISKISKEIFEKNKIDEKYFFEMLHIGFAHKRKYLISNLAEKLSLQRTALCKEKMGKVFEMCKLDKKVRAEDLSVNDWVNIYRNLN